MITLCKLLVYFGGITCPCVGHLSPLMCSLTSLALSLLLYSDSDRRRDMIGTKGTCLFLKPAVSTRRCFRCRRKSVIFFFFLLYSCETGSSIWALQPVTKSQSAQFSSSQTEGLRHQYQACCVLMTMHLGKKFLTLQCQFSVHRCQRQFSLLLLDVRCAFQVAYSNNHTPNSLLTWGDICLSYISSVTIIHFPVTSLRVG